MQVEIIQHGQVLRRIDHDGQSYVEAPSTGEYQVRVHNTSHRRRLIIVSVDGVNVVNGADASYEGGGYVLEPMQILDIPGFRRNDGQVAAFEFTEQGGSYAAATGRGTKNVGVIGVAVFDERVAQMVPVSRVSKTLNMGEHTWSTNEPGLVGEHTRSSDTVLLGEHTRSGSGDTMLKGSRSRRITTATKDVGTGYGRQVGFHTQETAFTRATPEPVMVITLRYATRTRLESWGVPVEKPNHGPLAANPFPAAVSPSVAAPPGWRG